MIPRNSKSLLAEFRMSRNQFEERPKEVTVPVKKKDNSRSPYEVFLKKYYDIENTVDKFGTRDIVYYFREVAQEKGYKYVISNIKKDMAIVKRLKENYSNREICGMIEFLYESDQDYLDKDRLSFNILASQWINTIYADMKLWVDDLYTPKSVKAKKKNSVKTREWDNEVANTKNDVNIGVTL